ncbi:hypothetical protein [Epilithonimonas mollis]|uniref:Uncharacterized protein n=1 Tax=Epilithonimonas mollis TaxID=216903 RepID=A0A1M6TCN2_9FLAO|nr:hypothetical protein [Epilithonimonas mollis]SHK54713.1 hypothetical protein SAMN05444371_2790 [Epilithonimonas mollis]
MKKVLLSLMLLTIMSIRGQISKDFGKEIKALLEAEAPDLMMNEFKSEYASTFYRTNLKLEGFEINYIVSAIIGNVLSAKYINKGDENIMESISIRLNTMSYLIYDSKYDPERFKLDDNTLRKILVKSNTTGKTLLVITLSQSDEIYFRFVRI